jgi:hypothetical protein
MKTSRGVEAFCVHVRLIDDNHEGSMEFAYRPEAWQNMFATVALTAATLTGLLFVGLSINLRTIVDSPAHLARAREAMISLVVLLIVSLLVLIPAQGGAALGIELLTLSVLVFALSVRLQSSTVHHLPTRRRRSWKARLIGLNGATLAITVAGAGLLMRGFGGLLWLVPTVLICLLWSTANAWTLVIHATAPSP